LARGQRLVELLKQNQFSPLSVEKQVVVIFTGTGGYLDDIEVADVVSFEAGLISFMDAKYGSLLAQIAKVKALDDAMRESLKNAIGEFKERFKADKEKEKEQAKAKQSK